MIPIIVEVISLLLDGILTNFLPYLENDLSYFTPLLTVVSIFLIYPFYRKKEKKYYINILILGLLYDLFYTNLLFMNAILFLLVGILSKFLYKNYEITWIRLIFYTVIVIVTYESLTVGILWIFQLVPITVSKWFYKITHSCLLNIIYMEILYGIIKVIPKKYKKISIN